jgi:hypothetical protein
MEANGTMGPVNLKDLRVRASGQRGDDELLPISLSACTPPVTTYNLPRSRLQEPVRRPTPHSSEG